MDTTAAPPSQPPARGIIFLAGGVIALAALAAYHGSFAVPFFFDDEPAITGNPSIRHLWPLGPVLSPPLDVTGAVGRPVVNLSLALNYALGGTAPWGYHALNLLLHALAGLTLFGVVRRTLLLPRLRARFAAAATGLAFTVALLWTLHPLQTETVTCVIQRTELLVGLFYLLTLYGFIRGAESPVPWRWHAPAIVACLLGMASKEVMVTAPVVVLLYDRTFVAGTFAAAWRQRWRFYLGLAATWVLLGYLVASTGGNRGGVVGYSGGASPWTYALTQLRAITLYLKLAFWPHPLVLDYGTEVVTRVADILPQALLLLTLAAATVFAVWRRPALGFLGAWFFVVISPSSSVVPLATQTIAEHRMYLPLAAVLVLAVLGLHALAGRRNVAAVVLVGLALAAGLGALTARRNTDYRSELAIWQDTVAKLPNNARAHSNLGVVLFQEASLKEKEAAQLAENKAQLAKAEAKFAEAKTELTQAEAQFAEAVRLNPNYAEARYNLGVIWLNAGRLAEAIAQFDIAVHLKPGYAEAYYNLGNALFKAGRQADGIAAFKAAVQIRPGYVEARYNLGTVLLWAGNNADAVTHLAAALAARPDYPEAEFNLGNALFHLGREPEARAHYAAALRLKPDYADVPYNLGTLLLDAGRNAEAIAAYEQALQIKPAYVEARCNLALALLRLGRPADAVPQFEQALRDRPDYPQARNGLALAQAALRAAKPGN